MGNAQTVNGSPIDEIDVQYVEIVGASKAFSSKLNIQIDFGQEVKFLKASKNTVIKDKEGKNLEFNSMVDALNFMSANGYEFVDSYAITVSNSNVFHFLLRKSE
ncbi:MAG: hypothetical protein RI562_09755 [Salibacter sp.]|uniref:hypothetical protein n=1 Tax=Salibacter sp. TaxID=2010995 RepID=UPI002870180E|nr:hypothetical protein [Salibacter sp.]MDR9399337.1 hypothetical protein [Salibacter sp.]